MLQFLTDSTLPAPQFIRSGDSFPQSKKHLSSIIGRVAAFLLKKQGDENQSYRANSLIIIATLNIGLDFCNQYCTGLIIVTWPNIIVFIDSKH